MKERMNDFFQNYSFETKLTGFSGLVVAVITLGQLKEIVAIAVGVVAIVCNVLVTRKKLKEKKSE